jgi:DNA-binding MarR family transcriptional regulator
MNGEDELAREVSVVFNQLDTVLKRHSAAELLRLLQREELSLPRGVALMFLDHNERASISDISQYLNLSLATTSQLVDQLVCAGYVTRAEDQHDRRQKIVALTDRGECFVQEFKRRRIDEVKRQLAHLPTPLLESTRLVLSEILAALPGEHSAD